MQGDSDTAGGASPSTVTRTGARRACGACCAQATGGLIETVPDLVGTRPFPYDIPALADHAALLTLAHLQRCLGAAAATPVHLPRRRAAPQPTWLIEPVPGRADRQVGAGPGEGSW